MIYDLQEAIIILSKTPILLRTLLTGLPDNWLNFQKHNQAFSAKDVIGHLILGEKYDWIPRLKIILSDKIDKTFTPFQREGFEKNTSANEILDEFEDLRKANIEILRTVTFEDLQKTGIHPEFGEVTLEQHLATWVVHDLNHLFQIIESMSLRYKDTVGPWIDYLKILKITS
jgi:hypothetical protein